MSDDVLKDPSAAREEAGAGEPAPEAAPRESVPAEERASESDSAEEQFPGASPSEEALPESASEADPVEEPGAESAPSEEAPRESAEEPGPESTSSEEAPRESAEEADPGAWSEEGDGDGSSRDASGDGLPEPAGESLPPSAAVPSGPPAEKEDEEEPGDGEGGRMSLMDHLGELRRRIVYSFIAACIGFAACWAFVEPIFDILVRPLLAALPEGGTAMYTTLPEAFFTRVLIAFIAGLFVASPLIFYQIWAFVAPGLYEEEKLFVMPVAFISAVFFIAGGLFCYFVVFKFAFSFFMSYSTTDVVVMPKISEYLDFVLKLLLAFGFIFEMPIFSFFLSRMGVLTAARMRSFRRYAILVIFIVAAVLTPPDVISQLFMAGPMILLYEVSIVIAAVFGKKPAPETAPDDDGENGEEA